MSWRYNEKFVSEPLEKENKSIKDLIWHQFKREIINIMVPLHRLKENEYSINFVEHCYYLVRVMCAKGEYVDKVQIMHDNLSNWLLSTKV